MNIKYNNTDITKDFLAGRWAHPETGIKYPRDWDASTIEGVTVETVEPVEVLEPLADIFARKNNEINAARLAANFSSFPFAGKQVACDQLSRSDIDAVNGIVAITNALPPNWVGGWRAMDGSIIPLPNLAAWVSFYAAMVQQGTLNFVKSQTLKTQLQAAMDAGDRAAMNAIAW
jgi:hypothetical protein